MFLESIERHCISKSHDHKSEILKFLILANRDRIIETK